MFQCKSASEILVSGSNPRTRWFYQRVFHRLRHGRVQGQLVALMAWHGEKVISLAACARVSVAFPSWFLLHCPSCFGDSCVADLVLTWRFSYHDTTVPILQTLDLTFCTAKPLSPKQLECQHDDFKKKWVQTAYIALLSHIQNICVCSQTLWRKTIIAQLISNAQSLQCPKFVSQLGAGGDVCCRYLGRRQVCFLLTTGLSRGNMMQV